jgi:hypothetical protein
MKSGNCLRLPTFAQPAAASCFAALLPWVLLADCVVMSLVLQDTYLMGYGSQFLSFSSYIKQLPELLLGTDETIFWNEKGPCKHLGDALFMTDKSVFGSCVPGPVPVKTFDDECSIAQRHGHVDKATSQEYHRVGSTHRV